jgi:hypothetical protein
MNKQELLTTIQAERDRLDELLTGLSEEELCQPALAGGWSIKDVIAHIAAWEHRCAFWIIDGLCHKTPELPQKGYTWDDIDLLNADTYLDYEDRTWESVWIEGCATYRHLFEFIENLSEDDIFNPDRFPWTEGKSLVPFIAANTYEHYREHAEQIRKEYYMTR